MMRGVFNVIIKEIIVYKVKMEMKNPFKTSYGTTKDRTFLILEAIDENGISGWGECVTSDEPLYLEEFTNAAQLMLEEHLIPIVTGANIQHPDEISELFRPFKRNNLAKSAIDGAVWDLYAKRENKSLSACLGGTRSEIEVGVSLGIEENIKDLLTIIEQRINEGYKRIKVKIQPGQDIEVIRSIRKAYPNLPLMADANAAYTLEDLDNLQKLDPFNLMMIEQPLRAGDLIDHATLQKNITTPVCLDESITSYEDTRQAMEIGSCKIINLKISRVGGLSESKRIHNLCVKNDIPLWCGGMLEAGIGRAHNIAISSLANFSLPGDTAASSKYWYKDIIQPEVTVEQGMLKVPDTPGIGYTVNRQALEAVTTEKKVFS